MSIPLSARSFLSYLYGSELGAMAYIALVRFLSYLYGSECLLENDQIIRKVFS
jgi:hypothetical protein